MSGYTLFFTLIGLLFPPSKPLLIPLRILCFPLNIWLLEIVQHEVFKFLFGFNPAWDYTGAPGSMCDGAINLAHAKLWLVLGYICAFCSPINGIVLVLFGLLVVHIAKFVAMRSPQKNFKNLF